MTTQKTVVIPALTLAMVALGACGLVRVDGMPLLGSSSPKSSPSQDSAMSSSSQSSPSSSQSSTASPSKELAIVKPVKVLFTHKGLNPMTFGTFKGKGTVDPRNMGMKSCGGNMMEEPALVFDSKKGLKNATLVAEGQVYAMIVLLPGGTFLCERGDRPSLAIKNGAPGTYKVYLGSYGGNQEITSTVVLEELDRKRDVEWLAMKRPTFKIDGNKVKTQMVSTHYSSEQLNSLVDIGRGHCKQSGVESPLVKLEVRKRSTVQIGVRANATGSIHLVGPIAADNRGIKSKCLSSWDAKTTLEPGNYFLRLGMRRNDRPSFVNFYVKSVEAALAPLESFRGTPKGLSVAERAIAHHFPGMTVQTLQKSDALRRELFLRAPAELFVKARLDLDKHSSKANVMIGSYSSSDNFRKKAEFEFPKANQALLLLSEGYMVMAADGSIFTVKASDLVSAESTKELALLERPMNTQLFAAHARSMAGDDDVKRMQAHKARWKKYSSCRASIFAKASGKFRKLDRYPHANRGAIASLRNELTGKAYTKCGEAKLRKADEKLWAELEVSRTKRRTVSLGKINQRLKQIF